MRFLLLLLAISLSAAPLEVKVVSPSAILMNAETGRILYQKDAHTPSYPASITKVATALFVLDVKRPQLEDVVTVSHDMLRMKAPQGEEEFPAHFLEIDGTKMGLKKGEVISYEALLHGLMLVSGNDAANALGESLSGSVPEFVKELNHYVKGLGCLNTQFQNPHGLHHPEHRTTAYDMCLITKKALTLPKFREIVSTVTYVRPKTNKQGALELRQTNPLIKPGKHFYSRAFGVKTGFTSRALHTFVGAAEHEGRTLIAVVLGAVKRTDRYDDVIRLFDAAFDETREEKVLFGKGHSFSREVEGGVKPLQAEIGKDVKIAYFPAEEPLCKAFVDWALPVLPIKRGQKVGSVRILDERGALLQTTDLLAKEEVQPTLFFRIKSFFL